MTDDRFTEHQRNAGRSRSPKKLAALAKNRKLAARARTVKNPSKSTLAKRDSRARIKAYCTSDGTLRERFGVEAMLKTLGKMRAKRASRARLTSDPSS